MADFRKKMCTFALEFIGKVSSHRRKSPKIHQSRSHATEQLIYWWAAVLRWIQVFGDTSSSGVGGGSPFLT